MGIIKQVNCIVMGHRWTHSRRYSGYRTCTRCRKRQLDPNKVTDSNVNLV